MTQKDTKISSDQILSEDVIDSIGESIANTLLNQFNNMDQEELTEEETEESIVVYAKAISHNEPEYFNRPNKELILEWAMKYIDTCAYYGKKL